MNIKEVAKEWLLAHGFDESNPSFEADLLSLANTIDVVYSHEGYVGFNDIKYDPKYGNDKVCACGHIYYRHFDSYDDLSPVECKYCLCCSFNEKK